MSTYYTIDDGHGDLITTGLQNLRQAREIAQSHANTSGLATNLYSSDREIDEVIQPSKAVKSSQIAMKRESHATMKAASYHVYAPDGFESAHRSLEAAERAARRGAKNRRLEYRVYLTSSTGFTGGGLGTRVYTANPPKRR